MGLIATFQLVVGEKRVVYTSHPTSPSLWIETLTVEAGRPYFRRSNGLSVSATVHRARWILMPDRDLLTIFVSPNGGPHKKLMVLREIT